MHTHTSPLGQYFVLHTVFFWFVTRQCRCCCVCSCGWHLLYTRSRRQMRCNMFHSVKTNKALIQSELLTSLLPKMCQKECFSCQQMIETLFGDIWGYCLIVKARYAIQSKKNFLGPRKGFKNSKSLFIAISLLVSISL